MTAIDKSEIDGGDPADPYFAPSDPRPFVSDAAVRWLCGTAMVLAALGLVAWLAVAAPEVLYRIAIFAVVVVIFIGLGTAHPPKGR